jgi:hypothetical protein
MAASDYTNPDKAKEILFDMTIAYMKNSHFGTLQEAERKEVADIIDQIKTSMI